MQVNADYSVHHQTKITVPIAGFLRILQEATNDLPKGLPSEIYYSTVSGQFELTWENEGPAPTPF